MLSLCDLLRLRRVGISGEGTVPRILPRRRSARATRPGQVPSRSASLRSYLSSFRVLVMANAPATAPAPHKNIEISITAFGPFHGVPDNPSSHLIRALPAHYAKHGRPGAKLLPGVIVETSAVGALQALQSLPAFSMHAPHVTHILVHFGVHGSATAFHIEQMAHNEANFRVDDERKWSPNRQAIVPNAPKQLLSPLPTPEIAHTLAKHFPTNLSTDPGRFVCNWLYYSSLHLAQARNAHGANILPLFVHIPPFAVMPLEKQIVRIALRMIGLLTLCRSSPQLC